MFMSSAGTSAEAMVEATTGVTLDADTTETASMETETMEIKVPSIVCGREKRHHVASGTRTLLTVSVSSPRANGPVRTSSIGYPLAPEPHVITRRVREGSPDPGLRAIKGSRFLKFATPPAPGHPARLGAVDDGRRATVFIRAARSNRQALFFDVILKVVFRSIRILLDAGP